MSGTYSKIKTVVTGETITAADRNDEHDNHITNADPDGIGDASASAAEMQATADPYPAASESLATDLRGELQRIRYLIKQLTGEANWYVDPDVNLVNEYNKGADIASATALVLGTDGNYFDVTGTTAITSITTRRIGSLVILHFDAILTFTHHATDLILPGAANITTAAGDHAIVYEYASGDWRCIDYIKASERPSYPSVAETFSGVKTFSAAPVLNGTAWPSFSVHKNGTNQTGVTTATVTQITWSTESFDTNSDFASNAFIPTVSGKYVLTVLVTFQGMADNDNIYVYIYKNGSAIARMDNSAGATGGSISGTICKVVDANGVDDDFDVRVDHDKGSDATINGSAVSTHFTGCRIG